MYWVFIRHGESEYSREGRYTGTTDIALTAEGHRQAAAVGVWLARYWFPTRILCSPKLRTRQTLEGLRDGGKLHAMPALYDERLREIYYGAWESMTREEILASDPDTYVQWEARPTHLRAGITGETATDVRTRVRALLESEPYDPRGITWFVTHRTVMRILMADLLEMPLDQYRSHFEQGHASVNIFKVRFDPAQRIAAQLIHANLQPWQS